MSTQEPEVEEAGSQQAHATAEVLGLGEGPREGFSGQSHPVSASGH